MDMKGYGIGSVGKQDMYYPLKIDDNVGLIFPSSIRPVSGTVAIEPEDKLDSYEILVLDRNSNEILRKSLRSEESSSARTTTFTWDLKSKSNSYVKSGCYIISLIDRAKEIECFSMECKVVDTRNILSIARSLKSSNAFTPDTPQTVLSIYFSIIGDIQVKILERLQNNRFEEPYFVASVTECFIQEIAKDIQNRPSNFLDRIAEFQSKNSMHDQQSNAKLNLWTLFDFLVNYMADMEDHVRANAMAKCGQRSLTRNDKAQIVSSLVLAIYPYCKTMVFPKNVIGSIIERITESIIKLGIKYVSTNHINKSISICQTLPLQNSCNI